MPRKIAASAIPDVARKLLQIQGGLCAICGRPIDRRSTDSVVVDHDHTTGIIRGAVHRSCNGAEGKVKAKAHLGHKGVSAYEFLIALGKYLEKHSKPQTQLIHPSHKSEEEKRVERNKKARLARARKKANASKR